ncbi:hypothetical protein L228DRAFT_282236 [Xylona heveae TC161]|uniref:C6 transcription factor n=1 Tax=Xylona heveae (strain CBS 132557 / TC161) TaxID=1328760 RepID=A0A165HHB1_XYLHT|nr:hypothetical protein L228DRAFT_282236 [Xylona heveae TC161]KZF23515.1 hypothetical protein L228DRAFT_282236 [Xylona heveae TC161]
MVSTRNHPKNFPEPTLSPTKSTQSKSVVRSSTPTSSTSSTSKKWTHTPSNLTLLWLAIAVPLVLWDAGYVFLRPHTMPGGFLHSPLWLPYVFYGSVDYVYGLPAFEQSDGFPAAQSALNLLETFLYVAYLAIVFRYGKVVSGRGRGAPKSRKAGWLGQPRVVSGQMAGAAVLIGYATAVMTLSKTVLYWLNEYYSGFKHIGHNDALTLIIAWLIPNGAWLAFPSYMAYVFGREILQGLAVAAKTTGKQE